MTDEPCVCGTDFTCLSDDHVPQPSSSTPEGRRRARAIYEQARREAASTCNPAAENEESA